MTTCHADYPWVTAPSPPQVADPSGGQMMGRANFSTRKFAAKHTLGDLIDVTWFNAHK